MLIAKVTIEYDNKDDYGFEHRIEQSALDKKGIETIANDLVDSIRYLDDEHCDRREVRFTKDDKEIALVVNGSVEWEICECGRGRIRHGDHMCSCCWEEQVG